MIAIKLPTSTFEYDPSRTLGPPGGFGQVYEGHAADGTPVAVKKLHLTAATAAHRELDMAEELGSRTFEHVMPFIDSGEEADTGDYYIVMPRADHSLQDMIDGRGPLDAPLASDILLQIVAGLIEVGDVVHRDLKPGNVLFHDGKWKVADFGLARFYEEATAMNTVKGGITYAYAAPEQWRFERATHATDVYALGCIGYCLLVGHPPFMTNFQESHLKDPFPDLTVADARLKNLVYMASRKVPGSRPTLHRVAEILNNIVATPVTAAAPATANVLAEAAAKVSVQEQTKEAALEAEALKAVERANLAVSGWEILDENIERLWGRIHQEAPNAQRVVDDSKRKLFCSLGNAELVVTFLHDQAMEANNFTQSGWDVILAAMLHVSQPQPEGAWSASLWYAKLPGTDCYRWYEVSYYDKRKDYPQTPVAAGQTSTADLAAADRDPAFGIAFGPLAVDDEMEDDFHQRWIKAFGHAVGGDLAAIYPMPIRSWPF